MADAHLPDGLRPSPRPVAQRLPGLTTSRIHVDLFTDTAEEQQAEVQRLVGLGARTVDWARRKTDSEPMTIKRPLFVPDRYELSGVKSWPKR
ncbi:VOC family protein [Streptomyces sp. NPDC005426]|uniref:VOC family protein n=1 Tax=Streptomyces sp. NPDC005426 TaxID=3155344 RepID=UPI0033AFEEB8